MLDVDSSYTVEDLKTEIQEKSSAAAPPDPLLFYLVFNGGEGRRGEGRGGRLVPSCPVCSRDAASIGARV